MKKLLFVSLCLLAVELRADDCSKKLTGPGFTPAQAKLLCGALPWNVDSSGNTVIESPSGKDVLLQPNGLSSSQLVVQSNPIDPTETELVFGDGTQVRPHLDIHGPTTDGNDDGYIIIGPGGNNNLEQGAAIVMYGNESSNNAGTLKLDCGNVTDAVVEIITPRGITQDSSDYRVRWYWKRGTGNLTNDATDGGNVVFAKAGTGLTESNESVAAAGSNQGTAAALTGRVSFVTGATGTNGVIFPATPTAGDFHTVYNAAASALLVYPGTGDAINGNAANTSVSVAANASLVCHAQSASQWRCGETANP